MDDIVLLVMTSIKTLMALKSLRPPHTIAILRHALVMIEQAAPSRAVFDKANREANELLAQMGRQSRVRRNEDIAEIEIDKKNDQLTAEEFERMFGSDLPEA